MHKQKSFMIEIPERQPEVVSIKCAHCGQETKTEVGLARHIHERHGYRGLTQLLSNQASAGKRSP